MISLALSRLTQSRTATQPQALRKLALLEHEELFRRCFISSGTDSSQRDVHKLRQVFKGKVGGIKKISYKIGISKEIGFVSKI